MIVGRRRRFDVLNRPESLIRSQEIYRQSRRPRRGVGRRRGVLILRQVSRPVLRRIEVAALQEVLAQGADVGDVEYRIERQLVLDPDIEGISRRRFALAVVGYQSRWRQQQLPAGWRRYTRPRH